jgi:hypothetical protein
MTLLDTPPDPDSGAQAPPGSPETDSADDSTTSPLSEALKALREPFPASVVGILPKPYKRDSPVGDCEVCHQRHGLPAIHLDYVGHAAVTDRLLTVDETWNWEPLALDDYGLPRLDSAGGMWIKLTIAGTTRLGYGDGGDPKVRIGDAIRNAAMRFGVALDLWTKDELESLATAGKTSNKRAAPKSSTPTTKTSQTPARVRTDPATDGKEGMSLPDRNKVTKHFNSLDPPVRGDKEVMAKVNALLEPSEPFPALVKLTVEDGVELFRVLGIS